jgi:oxygen-independent coproporphyrinogen-3 oxidase
LKANSSNQSHAEPLSQDENASAPPGGAALARAAYIHVPFCFRHCGYCNFTVIAGRGDLVSDYLQAIELELATLAVPQEVDTLYFGGGTPTQLSGDAWRRLLAIVREKITPAADAEITVEANPADINHAQAALFAELGVTRVSLGAQSFHDSKLRALERDHAADDSRHAVELLRSAGMGAIALDLIFAAPGETLEMWRDDLMQALALSPEHLSTYGLTFEKGTAFYGRLDRGKLVQCDEEVERRMYCEAIELLADAGFEHYEVSNFALPGKRSRHNQTYWTGAPYLAFGPGAASCVGGTRRTNHRSVTTYLRRVLAGESPVAESETLSPEDAARERLVFGLRRLEGIDTQAFACDTGFRIETLAGVAIEKFVALGLLRFVNGRLSLTREGLLVSDSLWPELL